MPNHVKDLILENKRKEFNFLEDPKMFPSKKFYVSGIFQTPPDFDIYINKILLVNMIIKVNSCMFSNGSTNTFSDFIRGIKSFLQRDDLLDDPFYYPMAQHLLCNTFANFKISSSILKNLTDYDIDYKFYEGHEVTINSIIEAIVFDATFKNMHLNVIHK